MSVSVEPSSVPEAAIESDLARTGVATVIVDRWQASEHERTADQVAEEVPVALVYNGVPHVVMLASPLDLEDFALGFSLTEGIIGRVDDVQSIRVHRRTDGIEVRLRVDTACETRLGGIERNLTGRTGCGLCGAATLQQAVRRPPPVSTSAVFEAGALIRAMRSLHELQRMNQLTGAVHAAAWVEPQKGLTVLREDVGRHNALDKLIGVLMRKQAEASSGFLLVTSRASFEMVQKCAVAGISLLGAVSAPTALAIRLATDAGICLIGFLRNDRYVVYSHPERLRH